MLFSYKPLGYDILATAVPGLPAGASTIIKTVRLANTGSKLARGMYKAAEGARKAKELVRFAVRKGIDEAHHVIPRGGPPMSWGGGVIRKKMDVLRKKFIDAGGNLDSLTNGVALPKGFHKGETLPLSYYERVLKHFDGATTHGDFLSRIDDLADALLRESGKLR